MPNNQEKFRGYDAIVIGTGFGGSMCAHQLAQAGMKVLVLERGNWPQRSAQDWDAKSILVEKTYQGPSPLLVKQYDAPQPERMVENEVVGGMSVFYGGASLRLRETDFDRWPIVYDALEPYYAQVEQALEVHGLAEMDPFEPRRSSDYLYPPISLTPPAQRIWQAGKKLGLSPFQMPLALNFSNDSRPICIRCLTCDGFPCQIEAKNDLTMTVLKQAQVAGADVMVGVQVIRLRVVGEKAEAVLCVDRTSKQAFEIHAPLIVVAGGALQSPAILLRSHLEKFPQHKMIGRFLMRHCNGVVAGVFPFRTNAERVFHKLVCFTDLYEDCRKTDGMATGVIQDIYSPDPVVLRHFAPRGFKLASALASGFLQNLLCVAEDEPQYDNAVTLSEQDDAFGVSRVQVTHRYSQRDCDRRDLLIGQAKRILRKAGALFFHTYQIDSFSHGVGSVRMGHDVKESVLDAHCRFHGLDNLFVVDGSVFPSSGGVNPSLTIAANALRVADYLTQTFRNI